MIKTFMLERTGLANRYLRRFKHSDEGKCVDGSYHQAKVFIDRVPVNLTYEDGMPLYSVTTDPEEFEGDPRWPTTCTKCGYGFEASDPYQVFWDQLYKRLDTEELITLRDAPPGAMWYAEWLEYLESDNWWKGPDGRVLMCKTPGGDWNIDGRASNCSMPEDNEHRCWVRHGTPPEVTIDKNGNTCAAGAGSIQCGDYHGFLQNGYLT